MGLLNCNPIFNYYVSTKHHFRTVHYIHTFIQTEFISAAEAIFGKKNSTGSICDYHIHGLVGTQHQRMSVGINPKCHLVGAVRAEPSSYKARRSFGWQLQSPHWVSYGTLRSEIYY